jgi:hypothetical protein
VIWVLTLLLQWTQARATEISTLNSSVRALGMGDAYTALADDDSSLFYNPAGLARVRGLNLKVFDVDAGANGLQEYQKIQNLKSAGQGGSYGNEVNSLVGSHLWNGLGAETIFTMPMLGFGVYDHAGATVQIDNPVYPQLHTRVINDYGYVAGIGVPLMPTLLAGVDVKYIKRTGTDTSFGPAALADLQPQDILGNLTGWGTGYGMDLGVTALIPAPLFTASLAAAWKNVGGITFHSANGTQVPSEENNITAGAALKFSTPFLSIAPAVDCVYLNDPTLQLVRKVNFGVEIGLPLVDIRGGFHEGYYTAGVGLNLGLFRVDAATYGVELGDYPGQIEDRRYAVQFTMQFDVGNFSALGDKKSGSSSSSSSSNSNSIWGGSSLKQRR